MKIGIIGTGKVASDAYLPFLASQSDVELSYWNRTREKADTCATGFGGAVCDGIPELVARATDAVFVLTSEKVRADILRELVPLNPARVFCEKPLVARNGQDDVTEDDFAIALDLMGALHAGGSRTAMIFNYRFLDQTLAAKRILSERSFGRPVNAVAFVNYACWSHCIDLLLDFVGPASVIGAQAGALRHGETRVADVVASITFANGAAGTIAGSWALNFGFPLFELIVNYEGGRFHFRGLDGDLEILDYATHCHETLSVTRNTSRWDQYRASFGKSLAAYLDSVRQHVEPPVPGQAGLRELQFEAGLRRSIREDSPVNLNEAFPL